MTLEQEKESIGQRVVKAWQGTSEPPNHVQRLALAVADAQVLLKFSIESHRKVPPRVIDDLIKNIDALCLKSASDPAQIAVEERAFWNAYEALGETIAPVTAESIQHSQRESLGWFSRSTTPYALVALAFFGLTGTCQWLWSGGITLRQNLIANETEVDKLRGQERAKYRESEKLGNQLRRVERETLDSGCGADRANPFASKAQKTAGAPKEDICKRIWREWDEVQERRIEAELDRKGLRTEIERTQANFDPRVELLEEWMTVWIGPYAGKLERVEVDKLRAIYLKDRANTDAAQQKLNALPHPERPRIFIGPDAASQASEISEYRAARKEYDQKAAPLREILDGQRAADGARLTELNRGRDNLVERLKHRVNQRIDVIEKYFLPLLLGALGSVIFILRSTIGAIRQSTYTASFGSLSVARVCLGTIAWLLGMLVIPRDMLPGKDILPLALPLLPGYAVEIFFTAMDRLVKAFCDSPK